MKVEGLRELERALAELPKATGKNVLRRTARDALEPMRAAAEGMAPRQFGDLAASIEISDKRTPAAKRKTKVVRTSAGFRSARSEGVEMAMGPTKDSDVLNYATFQEFGTVNMPPQPFMRPAWDAEAKPTVERVKDSLWGHVSRAATKRAKKLAKAGAK
jgi:HK97 gp10 family phage protein